MSAELLKEGDSLLHYRILGPLGAGGMGTVYRAQDTRLGRTVALKILREDRSGDEEWNQRFQREVRVVSSFSHPGIATLYDFHRDGTTFFYAMELVDGRNLRDVLKDGALPLPALLDCAVQMADALGEAHQKGVVHRDLKPENVMESGTGYYKILDFGLACFTPEGLASSGSASLLETVARDATRADQVVGTVNYMSPEQAGGTEVDARSDIFAFGSLLYELATGEPPFKRNTAIATFHAIVHEEPAALRAKRPELPKELSWIISRCHAKDPGDRYQSARDLGDDLRALTYGGESGSQAISRIRPPGRATSGRGKRWVIGLVATAAVAALAIVVGRPWVSAPPMPTVGRPPRPAPVSGPIVPQGERYIAISPFANQTGDPAADWLVRGVPEMLTTQLAGANLKVLSTQRLDDFASTTGGESFDLATATEVARWAGASIAVAGSIYKVGERYRIDAQAYDTDTGEVLAAANAEGEDIFRIVGQLTLGIQSGLQVELPGESQLVGTSSEEAFGHYAEGMALYEETRYAESVAALERSVQADTSFALGSMRLGMALYLAGEEQDGLKRIIQVADGEGHLPQRDTRLVGILRAYAERDSSLAAEQLELFQKEYPHDQEATFWKAQALADLDEDRMGAIRLLRGVLFEEPDHFASVVEMSSLLAELGAAADARLLLEGYRERHPRVANTVEEILRDY